MVRSSSPAGSTRSGALSDASKSSIDSASLMVSRKRSSANKGTRGPRPRLFRKGACQADGCAADLLALPFYYQRNHICLEHNKASSFLRQASLEARGEMVRFCQRCGLSHDLQAFDADKRSCRRQLDRHNARRRRATVAAGGESASGGSSQASPAELTPAPSWTGGPAAAPWPPATAPESFSERAGAWALPVTATAPEPALLGTDSTPAGVGDSWVCREQTSGAAADVRDERVCGAADACCRDERVCGVIATTEAVSECSSCGGSTADEASFRAGSHARASGSGPGPSALGGGVGRSARRGSVDGPLAPAMVGGRPIVARGLGAATGLTPITGAVDDLAASLGELAALDASATAALDAAARSGVGLASGADPFTPSRASSACSTCGAGGGALAPPHRVGLVGGGAPAPSPVLAAPGSRPGPRGRLGPRLLSGAAFRSAQLGLSLDGLGLALGDAPTPGEVQSPRVTAPPAPEAACDDAEGEDATGSVPAPLAGSLPLDEASLRDLRESHVGVYQALVQHQLAAAQVILAAAGMALRSLPSGPAGGLMSAI